MSKTSVWFLSLIPIPYTYSSRSRLKDIKPNSWNGFTISMDLCVNASQEYTVWKKKGLPLNCKSKCFFEPVLLRVERPRLNYKMYLVVGKTLFSQSVSSICSKNLLFSWPIVPLLWSNQDNDLPFFSTVLEV